MEFCPDDETEFELSYLFAVLFGDLKPVTETVLFYYCCAVFTLWPVYCVMEVWTENFATVSPTSALWLPFEELLVMLLCLLCVIVCWDGPRELLR